ncbi:hypothetical protein JTE90_021749 [Oedothorax gibbosus]|uniref:Gamma-aminobutyric acid type B receptor subunit 2 n=1 Tax=Oedothorax gibbosus TaxID=931172 RepID=A0AAV6UFV5_9ARAC|nr:hypothetical protein JTE90_021749 [Oedothorax gibbosus]
MPPLFQLKNKYLFLNKNKIFRYLKRQENAESITTENPPKYYGNLTPYKNIPEPSKNEMSSLDGESDVVSDFYNWSKERVKYPSRNSDRNERDVENISTFKLKYLFSNLKSILKIKCFRDINCPQFLSGMYTNNVNDNHTRKRLQNAPQASDVYLKFFKDSSSFLSENVNEKYTQRKLLSTPLAIHYFKDGAYKQKNKNYTTELHQKSQEYDIINAHQNLPEYDKTVEHQMSPEHDFKHLSLFDYIPKPQRVFKRDVSSQGVPENEHPLPDVLDSTIYDINVNDNDTAFDNFTSMTVFNENYFFENVSDNEFLQENETEFVYISAKEYPGIGVYEQRKKGVIYIHGLFELSKGECRDYPDTGRYEFEAAKFAIRQINERKVIDGYQLEMYYNDTLCDAGVAVDAFFHSLYRKPIMTALLGPGSSEVTERLARVVSRWNIVQMSYGATSPVLSDRKNFPMFFRTVSPDSSHNSALLAFILHHKWSTVATLHEQGDKHSLPMAKLATDLEQVNVTVSLTKGTSERDYKDHLREIKNQDCRIIICSFSAALFRQIFCENYHLGMYGPDYAWIILGDTSATWWEDMTPTECDDHQLNSAMSSVITVGSYYEIVGNETSVSETTMPEILDEIGYTSNRRSSGYVAQTYDAVWALALALRDVEANWRDNNSSLTLGDFTYDNHDIASRVTSTLSKLHFMGVSGPVSFRNSDRVGFTAFHQRQGNDLKLVAIYSPGYLKLQFQCPVCSDIEWQGGSPPISSRNIVQKIAVLDRRVFYCVTALAVLGVSLALIFLSFNLYYRKFKFIKLSSPNLNNFVIVGCILVYIAVILLAMDHGTLLSDNHFSIVCSARAFLLSGGFSLAFGCMFIKTYRVYHIFIRANTGIVKSKLLHDQQLLGLVSVLLLIDCILIILWVVIDPMERKLINLSMQVNKDERNVVYLNLREHCSSVHMAKWLGSLYIYKGLLLVVGCYMAWETRHVKVPALNDSQYIGMSVYNVVLTSIIVVALANVIPAERYTLTLVLVSTLIFISTTTTLCILFVPKIHTIYLNPENAGVVATPGVKVECKTRRFAINDESRESTYRAEVLNRALKKELKELDEEYNKVADKLGIPPCIVRGAEAAEPNPTGGSTESLPPWVEEYREYDSEERDKVWCTGRPTIASAFSAIHHVALQIPSTSRGCRVETLAKVHFDARQLEDNACSPLRSSFIAMDNREETPLIPSKQVRMFLSDRALNKLKIPSHACINNDKYPTLQCHPLSKLKKQMHSDPRLYPGIYIPRNTTPLLPGRSLNQVHLQNGSQSDFSKTTTSGTSNWETAPLHESTSFSTPLEDFWSSSINGNSNALKSSEETPSSNYISYEDENTNESLDLLSNPHSCCRDEVHSHPKYYEERTLTTSDSSKLEKIPINKNYISGSSSSICGPNISDLSTDTDESPKEFLILKDIHDNTSLSNPKGNESQNLVNKLPLDTITQNSETDRNNMPSSNKKSQNREKSARIIKESEIVVESKPMGGARAKTNRNMAVRKTCSKKVKGKSLRNEGNRYHQASNCYEFKDMNEGCIYNDSLANSQDLNYFNGNVTALPSSSESHHLIEPPVEERINHLRQELFRLETSNLNNNSTEPQERINRLRHHIFRLERELILLQLDQAESIDL